MDEAAIDAMIWRAFQENSRLSRNDDFKVVNTLMRVGLKHDFGYDRLQAFRGAHRNNCFGFFRDQTHYAGICTMTINYQCSGAMLVQTDGDFKGVWAFLIDTNSSVFISHNNNPVSSFLGFEGYELIEAVVGSALTTELKQSPERRRWLRRS